MKIATYSICKDEEKNIDQFVDSVKDSDYIIVLDTGSFDKSVLKLRDRNVNVQIKHIEPWRFDVARNEALKLIPNDVDVCISIDMDETLSDDWRQEIESKWVIGNNRAYHWYQESSSGYRYRHHKIHSRYGWKWFHAVHEELYSDESENICWTDIVMMHHPDESKSRSQYLELVKIVMKESPNYVRARLYYVTELIRNKMYSEAIDEIAKTLNVIDWYIERSYFCSLAAYCYMMLNDFSSELNWRYRAITYAPDWREPWFNISKCFFNLKKYEESFRCATMGINLDERFWVSYSDQEAWGPKIYQIAAQSAELLGNLSDAERYFNIGARLYQDHKNYPSARRFTEEYGSFLTRHK